MADRDDVVRARTDDLIIEQLEDETLVFDRRTDQAHCLSPEAAAVWRACDGHTPYDALVEVLRQRDVEAPELVVDRVLAELADRGLFDVAPGEGVSRRAALRRMAQVGAGALVVSVGAPVAIAAASGGTLAAGATCTGDNQCAGMNNCYQGTVGPLGGTPSGVKHCAPDNTCRASGVACSTLGVACCSGSCSGVVGTCA